MNSIEDNICSAIDIIVQQAISQADFDRTIQATIVSCIDQTIGKYKVKYQDSSFYAYSNNAETTYSDGSSVYVLIPNNDMSRDKTILGTTKKLGTNYISTVTGADTYNFYGSNCIEADLEYNFCSYDSNNENKNTITIYNKNSDNNLLSVDTIGLEFYLKNANYLMCGATFRTQLPQEQQSYGNYGVIFGLKFLDSNENEIIRYYVIDADKITGNPYKLISDTEQLCFFEIDGQNFVSLETIQLFIKDFPNDREAGQDYDNDILIKGFKLYAANHLTDEELDSYCVSISTPRGAYFKAPSAIQDKILKAEVKVKGKVVDENSQKLSFYWFEEQGNITTSSIDYCSYGGSGWKCLNSFKTIAAEYDEEGNVIGKPVREWLGAKSQYTVKRTDVKTEEKTYKCVALYDGNIISSTVLIKNFDAEYKLELISDSGFDFTLDEGEPIITCNLYFSNELQETDNYKFIWTSFDNTGYFQNRNAVSEDEPNKTQVQVNEIVNYITLKCSVYEQNTGDFIGTISAILTNSLEDGSFNLYDLVIVNGTKLFKYNENGIAPTSESFENPMVLEELTYYIYDNVLGKMIQGKDLLNVSAHWYVPANNTLLEGLGNSSYNYIDDVNIFNGSTLSYSIADRYNIKSQRNNIELKVTYNDYELITSTDFTFLKDGESGTNGTNYVCRIVPNTKLDTSVYYKTLKNGKLNFTPQVLNKWFRVQLWENSEKIFDSTKSEDGFTLSWEILRNKYGSYRDGSGDSIPITEDTNIDLLFNKENDLTYTFGYNKTDDNYNLANIIKATVTHDKKTYYATEPIATILIDKTNYNIKIKDYSGFKYAIYQSDGTNPSYDNTSAFELQVFNSENTDITDVCTYEWNVVGGYYEDEETWIDSPCLTIREEDQYEERPHRCWVTPISKISGEIISNAVTCIISQNDSYIGTVHIPVHLYLNRYGLSNINGWDGNSVEISEEGGYILSPQVGAGVKNEDNSFTGVVMGEVKESNSYTEEVGLFAYANGERSFFLNAEDGSATFGLANSNQIIIDPNKDKAIIKSGNYKTGSNGSGMQIDFSTPEIKFGSGNFTVDSEGKLTASGADINGNFRTRDTTETGTVYVQFNGDGFRIDYEDNEDNTFYMTQKQFIISGKDEDDNENSIRYSNGQLKITGRITATSGTIGGWYIESDRIKAKDGCLVLYADGRIVGSDIGTTSGTSTGYLISQSATEKTEIGAGQIKFYSAVDAENNKWTLEGYIYTYNSTIYTYDNINFQGALTLSSKGTKPLLFAANGKIGMALMPQQNDNKSYLLFPATKTTEEDKLDENGNVVTDKDGNTVTNKTIEIRTDCTQIDSVSVQSKDFIFPPNHTTGKTGLVSNNNSLKAMLNELYGHPEKIVFNDEEDTITEYWKITTKKTDNTNSESEDEDDENTEDSSSEEEQEFDERVYKLTVENKDTDDEEVTAITFPDGTVMSLEGFGGI